MTMDATGSNPSIPKAVGKLSQQHEAQISVIRNTLQKWLQAFSDAKEEKPGSGPPMEAALIELSELQVAEPFAFTPSSPHTYRTVLLSITKCYWMALVASLTEDEKEEMEQRLDCIPPSGRIPQMVGGRCVEKPEALTSQEYEGIMRVGAFIVIGMATKDMVNMWRELAEVGVQTWEEEVEVEDEDEEE